MNNYKDSINQDQILSLFEEELLNIDGLKQTARRSELMKGIQHKGPLVQMLFEGFDPKRSGDLLLILESGYLPKSTLSLNPHQGTSHGSGYSYDTHVPCLWYGGGIRKNEILEPLNITDIGPTLLELLNLPRLESMVGSTIKAIKP